MVTGAASGIGRATALRLVREGALVIATDGNAEGLTSLVAEESAIRTIQGDLRSSTFVDEFVAFAEAVGAVHILANVAGIMDHFVPVGDIDDELWDNVLAVNLTAPMRLCRRLVPLMAGRGRGVIINVASVAGLGGSGAGAAYISSKHGIIGLTRHIAYSYSPQGIRCNAVCPGGVATNIGTTAAPTVPWSWDRQQLGISLGERTAQPDEIAAVISWLACDEASNVNGAIMAADGGWKAA
jgi:NAD(P)-dependent dehydrogenase (short-subunit alcohol dehydrogenase family)